MRIIRAAAVRGSMGAMGEKAGGRGDRKNKKLLSPLSPVIQITRMPPAETDGILLLVLLAFLFLLP